MKIKIFLPVFFSAAFFIQQFSVAQIPNCGTGVPTYAVNFTGPSAATTWTSPSIIRNDTCCGNPPACVNFIITTDSQTVAIIIVFCGGPLPPGAINFQLDCGVLINYGDTIFISTPGIHYLTFCKPGTSSNSFCISSLTPAMITGITAELFNSSILSSEIYGDHFLSLTLPSPSSFALTLISADGKKVSDKNYSLQSGRQQIPLSTENLPQGIYFVRFLGEKTNSVIKLIKQ